MIACHKKNTLDYKNFFFKIFLFFLFSTNVALSEGGASEADEGEEDSADFQF